MRERTYKDRGYKVFEKSGSDLPVNPRYDEFGEILVLEGRRMLPRVIPRIKSLLKKILRIVLVLVIIAVYTTVVFSIGRLGAGGNEVVVQPIVEQNEEPVLIPTSVNTNVPAVVITSTPVTLTTIPPAMDVQTLECKITVQSNESVVNIRLGPGIQFGVVATAGVGDELNYFGMNDTGDWILVGENQWLASTLATDPICK